MKKILGIIFSVLVCSGCAATQKSTGAAFEGRMVQGRLDLLESNVRSSNQDIRSIQQELADLRRECLTSSEFSGGQDSWAYRSISESASTGNVGKIIRVDGVTVEQVQRALKKAGFYDGNVDGKLGPRTQRAIKEFQRANQMTVDGVVGRGTWGRLKNNL
ncbi:MAG TPA: peptidoglycan-binding domain-containing protein [Candidatus Bathyarchaeia archaeon]|nr:peptidoglycan-binding domain-containing protein [Candidatus Bathyarchaeia archaeon]